MSSDERQAEIARIKTQLGATLRTTTPEGRQLQNRVRELMLTDEQLAARPRQEVEDFSRRLTAAIDRYALKFREEDHPRDDSTGQFVEALTTAINQSLQGK